MNSFYIYMAIIAFILIVIYITDFNWKRIFANPYVIIGVLGLIIRFFVAGFITGFETDISCFKSWGQMLYKNGFSNFYTSNTFTDYPPGYMYVLYITGMLSSTMNLPYESGAYTLLIKFPAIIADIAAAMFIYKLALKKNEKNISLLFGLAYVLNPVAIHTSAGWGQVDAVHTLVLFAVIYYLYEKKLLVSMLLYSLALLIKPQSAMFAPIFLFVFYERIWGNKRFNKTQFINIIKYSFICFLSMLVFIKPFVKGLDYSPIIKQYYDTLASYPYASVSAYNFYTMLGLNWSPLTTAITMVGTVSIIIIVIISFYVLNKTKKEPNYFFVAALINILTFMFSVKMHERYIFPALGFLLASMIYKKDKRLIFLYTAFTLTTFANCVDVLYMVQNGNSLSLVVTSSRIISVCNVIATAYVLYFAFSMNKRPQKLLLINWERMYTNPYVIIGALGFIIRIVISRLITGVDVDLNVFKSWGQMLYNDGFSDFYAAGNAMGYTPGYMYMLYISELIRNAINLPYESGAYTFMLKLPSIIADIAAAMLIYKLALSKHEKNVSLIFALAYAMSPLAIYISAGWGQVDAFYMLLLFVAIYYLYEEKLLASMLLYTLSALIKPQSVMFIPIFLFVFYEKIFGDKRFNKTQFINILKYISICVLFALVFVKPFVKGFDYIPLIKQYYDTLALPSYVSVNAYNLYTAMGLNLVPMTTATPLMGTASVIIIFIISFYVLNKTKKEPNYFFAAALINILMFIFSVKMRELYIFPAAGFLLTSIIYKKDKRLIFLYAVFTFTTLFNCVDISYMMIQGGITSSVAASSKIISICNLAAAIYILYFTFSMDKKSQEQEFFVRRTEEVPFSLQESEKKLKLTRIDFILMFALTTIYALIAFYQLGDRFAPQTEAMLYSERDPVVVDFGEEYYIKRAQYMFIRKEDRRFSYEFSSDGKDWGGYIKINPHGVYSWGEVGISQNARYLRIKAISEENGKEDVHLSEMAFRDQDENLIPIKVISGPGTELFDEQELVPIKRGYMNGTYFDEIYHPRTAYELIHKMRVYEWTHPPLGKSIISAGIMIFGMNPFGFRVMGTFFGVLMVPIMYLFGKRMFKDTFFAVFTATVFSFDFMHLAQTRIGTIDSYVTFFIILMYYFMYEYYTISFYDTELKKTFKPLVLCGISFGLATACKWQGVYASLGLAVIFFMTIYRRWREYGFEKRSKRIKSTGMFPLYTFKTISWCFLFFVFIPLAVYFLSYFQYIQCEGSNTIQAVIDNQSAMLSYHARTTQEHPYMSSWWSWPLSLRPILYVTDTVSEGVRSTISSFNNPAVSWFSVAAIFYCIAAYSRKFDKNSIFLLIGFCSQYLTWIPIVRTTYMYHYFPSLPFLVLMIAYMFKDRFKKKAFAISYMALVVILFIMFYNIISGVPVSSDYIEKLKWLPGWSF